MWLTKKQIDYASVALKLSALLGRSWNVKVLFGGHPSTDGETILLPHWNFDDPALRTALFGLIAHEAGGHVRQTDFELLGRAVTMRKTNPDFTVWKSCENILEDIRIEANLLRQYPGAVIYLTAAVEYMLCRHQEEPDSESYWQLALNWCLFVFRYECLGQSALASKARYLDDTFKKVVPPDVLLAAQDIAHAVSKLGPGKGEFARVISHADELFTLLDAAKPSNQPKPSEEPEGVEPSSDASPSETEGDTGAASPQSDQRSPSGSSDREGPSSGGRLSEAAPADALGDVFGDLAEIGALPAETRTDIPVLGVGNDASSSVGLTVSSMVVRRAFQAASAMRQSLTAAVAPMLCGDMEYSANAKTGNKLNSQRIARALAEQEPAVFRRVLIEDDQSVAVQILLDRSGSTAGDCLFHEMVSAIGLVSALEQFPDVETSISYFPPNFVSEPQLTGAPLLKMFGEPLGKTFDRWPVSSGGTPLAEAYIAAALNFLLSQKQRRLLICLTDGEPSDAVEARKQKDFLHCMGIEVYGIVVSTDPYPAELFDESIQIADARQLPHSLACLVRKIL